MNQRIQTIYNQFELVCEENHIVPTLPNVEMIPTEFQDKIQVMYMSLVIDKNKKMEERFVGENRDIYVRYNHLCEINNVKGDLPDWSIQEQVKYMKTMIDLFTDYHYRYSL